MLMKLSEEVVAVTVKTFLNIKINIITEYFLDDIGFNITCQKLKKCTDINICTEESSIFELV